MGPSVNLDSLEKRLICRTNKQNYSRPRFRGPRGLGKTLQIIKLFEIA